MNWQGKCKVYKEEKETHICARRKNWFTSAFYGVLVDCHCHWGCDTVKAVAVDLGDCQNLLTQLTDKWAIQIAFAEIVQYLLLVFDYTIEIFS